MVQGENIPSIVENVPEIEHHVEVERKDGSVLNSIEEVLNFSQIRQDGLLHPSGEAPFTADFKMTSDSLQEVLKFICVIIYMKISKFVL